jgi:hypothetical protein
MGSTKSSRFGHEMGCEISCMLPLQEQNGISYDVRRAFQVQMAHNRLYFVYRRSYNLFRFWYYSWRTFRICNDLTAIIGFPVLVGNQGGKSRTGLESPFVDLVVLVRFLILDERRD